MFYRRKNFFAMNNMRVSKPMRTYYSPVLLLTAVVIATATIAGRVNTCTA